MNWIGQWPPVGPVIRATGHKLAYEYCSDEQCLHLIWTIPELGPCWPVPKWGQPIRHARTVYVFNAVQLDMPLATNNQFFTSGVLVLHTNSSSALYVSSGQSRSIDRSIDRWVNVRRRCVIDTESKAINVWIKLPCEKLRTAPTSIVGLHTDWRTRMAENLLLYKYHGRHGFTSTIYAILFYTNIYIITSHFVHTYLILRYTKSSQLLYCQQKSHLPLKK